MLTQFTVENFLSFDTKTTFSMLADESDKQHPSHVIDNGNGKAASILRAAALYGANGAGKSNLVKAVGFARRMILRGTQGNQRIPVTPFKLGSDTLRPSRFEFVFIHEDVMYSYGFLLNDAQILEEWLYATGSRREVRYFERVTSANRQTTVEFGTTFSGRTAKQKQFLEFVAQATRPNQLFLTAAREHNVAAVAPVIEWLEGTLTVISAEEQTPSLEGQLHANSEFAEFAGTCLREAGTGVEAISAQKMPVGAAKEFARMPDALQQDILQQLQEEGQNGVLLRGPRGEREVLIQDGQDQPSLLKLEIKHRAQNSSLVDFDVSELSEGTQRLLHLTPALFQLRSRPRVLFIDELDRRLHPLLSRYFVRTALDCAAKSVHSQLIFTTHETSLLDLDLLRRDEIWFVEKDHGGASRLYSLAEFNIRPDLKIQKGYLNGRFGAIPFVGDICSLGWTQNTEASNEAPVEATDAVESVEAQSVAR